MSLDRELEDLYSGTVSCGDGGSFAAKFSAITRILAKYLHLWKYDAPCYKFSSKPHPITAELAWFVTRSVLPWLRSNRTAQSKRGLIKIQDNALSGAQHPKYEILLCPLLRTIRSA
jgi:hypothetical protein